jgi:hypothetical protein
MNNRRIYCKCPHEEAGIEEDAGMDDELPKVVELDPAVDLKIGWTL